MRKLKDCLGSLALLVSAAYASLPYQAQAEEGKLDCSAKAYYGMKRQLEIEGKDDLTKFFNLVRNQPNRTLIGTYFGPKKTQEGQYNVKFEGDDYVGRTLSLIVEYVQGKEIGTVNVKYDVGTKQERSGESSYEISLQSLLITAPDGRVMHPFYEKGQEYSARPEIAHKVADALVGSVLESILVPAKSKVAMCNAQVRTDWQTVQETLQIKEEKKKEEQKTEKDKPKQKK